MGQLKLTDRITFPDATTQTTATANTFNGYLQVDSTTQISVQRDGGNVCRVGGENIDPGAGGIACLTTDNLIAADGTDAGAAMGASTLYYLYVSNSSASFAASDLRASATAPSLLNGVKYLATTGNGANWRYCGSVYTNASTQITDSVSARHLCNEYNARWKALEANPGYVDDSAYTTYNFSSATFAPIHGGTGDSVSFVANGRDAVDIRVHFIGAGGVGQGYGVGIGRSSTSSPVHTVDRNYVAGDVVGGSISDSWIPAAGLQSAHMLAACGAFTITFYADAIRQGAAADVSQTFLIGMVKV